MFGEIVHIPLQDNLKYFVLSLFTTVEFSHHFFAYNIVSSEEYKVVELSQLALHQVLHKYHIMSKYYVIVRSCSHVELLI